MSALTGSTPDIKVSTLIHSTLNINEDNHIIIQDNYLNISIVEHNHDMDEEDPENNRLSLCNIFMN
jgi:hypothetical protein